MAAMRFGKGQLGRGWTTWHTAWRERCEQKRLLRQLAGRLMKPKLGHSYGFWRHSWEAERLAIAEDRSAAKWASKSVAAEAERSKLQLELAEARAAMLEGSGHEAELRRLAEEEVPPRGSHMCMCIYVYMPYMHICTRRRWPPEAHTCAYSYAYACPACTYALAPDHGPRVREYASRGSHNACTRTCACIGCTS